MLRSVRLAIFHKGIFASDGILLNWPGNLAGCEQHCPPPPPPLLPGQDSMPKHCNHVHSAAMHSGPLWHCLAVPLEKGG
jgi:hypothetical protein